MTPTHAAGTDVYTYECPCCDRPWFSLGDPPDERVRVFPALRVPAPDLEHPVLLAYVLEPDEYATAAPALEALVDRLCRERTWTPTRPQFVDVLDESSCSRPEDQPIRTLGAALQLSAPDAVQRTPRADIDAFFTGLVTFCRDHRMELWIELHGEQFGEVSTTGELWMVGARLDPWP